VYAAFEAAQAPITADNFGDITLLTRARRRVAAPALVRIAPWVDVADEVRAVQSSVGVM
jgi:hypothetical protein